MDARALAGVMIGTLLGLLTPGVGLGQKSDPKPDDSNVVTVWVSEVATGNPAVWEELGRFPTYQEASDRSLRWSKDNPKSLRLTREREIKVRITRPGPGPTAPPSSGDPKGGTGGTPKPPAAKVDVMEGMWAANCGSFYFSKGGFTHVCSGTPLQGRYQLTGDRIRLTFDNGTSITGTLEGGRVNGTMTNPKSGITKDITLTKR